MKTSFKSFLVPPSDEIEQAWKADDAIFIFDTNVLLNLYGFEEQTRTDFFTTVSKLGDRIFLPFHVGLEFNMQRLSVIRNEKKTFRELTLITERLQAKLSKDLEQLRLREKFPEVCDHSNELCSDIQAALEKFKLSIEPWNKSQPDVRSEDKILSLIDKFSDGHIGPAPLNQQWLDELYKEGEDRYTNKIPPGFRDITKDNEKLEPKFIHNRLSYQRKYGDLIIWKQILSEAERTSVRNVFFVTDDAKDDWWSIINSGGDKIIGPHEALRAEIYNLPNVNLFHMYSTSDFLENGGKILDVEIKPRSIEDAIIKHVDVSKDDTMVQPVDDLDQSPKSDTWFWVHKPDGTTVKRRFHQKFDFDSVTGDDLRHFKSDIKKSFNKDKRHITPDDIRYLAGAEIRKKSVRNKDFDFSSFIDEVRSSHARQILKNEIEKEMEIQLFNDALEKLEAEHDESDLDSEPKGD